MTSPAHICESPPHRCGGHTLGRVEAPPGPPHEPHSPLFSSKGPLRLKQSPRPLRSLFVPSWPFGHFLEVIPRVSTGPPHVSSARGPPHVEEKKEDSPIAAIQPQWNCTGSTASHVPYRAFIVIYPLSMDSSTCVHVFSTRVLHTWSSARRGKQGEFIHCSYAASMELCLQYILALAM